jgi:hypothetical protein
MRTTALLLVPLLASCSGAGALKVLQNPPAVSITEPSDGAVFDLNEAITFRGIVDSQTPADTLIVQWDSDIDGDFGDEDPPDPQGFVEVTTANLSGGTHVITLRATDQDAQQGEKSIVIEIDAPEEEEEVEEPWISITHPVDEERGLSGEIFVFAARVGDQQDDPADLLVTLSTDVSGLVCDLSVDGAGNAQCGEDLPIGDYELTFTVEDLDGNISQAIASYKVLDPDDYDFDGDGVSINGGDCNDDNNTIYPGAPEICDGLDNDCNEATGIDVGSECYDDDGDGYCEVPPCINATESVPDCDDTLASVSPAGVEAPNGIDEDCDGTIDEGTVVYDDDGDGYCEAPPCVNTGNSQSDCNDADYSINPGATEICSDGIDQNCNGQTNEQNASGCRNFYYDSDGDGYGVSSPSAQCWCDSGSGAYTANNTNDCYDSNNKAYPGASTYYSYDRGDGSYDYNCNGSDEKQYTATTGGCSWSVITYIACDVNGEGFDGSVPGCGSTGQWVDDCDGTYDALCYALCLASGTSAWTCLSSCSTTCDPDYSSVTQSCR